MSVEWHRLGEYIEVFDIRNTRGRDLPVLGLNKDKTFMPTVANMEGIDTSKYKVVTKDSFVFSGMQTGRDVCIRLGHYKQDEDALISPAYTTFRLAHNSSLLSEYFFACFNRSESDRLGWFLSDSSVRANLDWPRFLDIEIPVPPLAEQKKAVEAWQGLRKMKEQNEQLAEPLLALCRSYLQDCKNKYEMVEIGGLIEPLNERNRDDAIKAVRGMSTEKEFRVPQSRVDFDNLTNYKIVRHHDFVFVPTTDTWRCLAICLSRDDVPFLVSPIYEVFRFSDEQKVMPEFFHLWCKRQEFDRYARYNSWGSARENFSLADMCRVKIPLPPLDVQQAIVDVYRCANDAKRIAAEADRLSREICPALIRHVVNED